MSYQVLARKYRPLTFETVAGQEHVIKSLQNAVRRNKIGHAYLFSGPRGVGKTSIARIFSKALNCQSGPTPTPCGTCANCQEIAQGISLCVREIDGASHNSVDNVRELIDSFRSLPAPGYTYKVYIIDEVHMLSVSAFNALLKSLEEPPPHTVFILATTEVHKIPETVLSRCQRFDLRALPVNVVVERLKEIAAQEQLAVDESALRMIARLGEGSVRDAQSLFDRVASFCEGPITEESASVVLGAVQRKLLFNLASAILGRNPKQSLETVEQIQHTGVDPSFFLKEFTEYWRELLLAKFRGKGALEGKGLGADEIIELIRLVEPITGADIQDLVHLVYEGADFALRSSSPALVIESLVVRLATRVPVLEIHSLLKAGELTAPEKRTEIFPGRESPSPQEHIAVSTPPSTKNFEPTKRSEEAIRPRALEWRDFVAYVSTHARMLSEYLKRIALEEFHAASPQEGIVSGSGPEFTVKLLLEAQNKEKLERLLSEFSGISRWKVLFRGGEGASVQQESLVIQEKKQAFQRSEEMKRNLLSHPVLESIKEAFPGSTVEKVNTKKG